MMLENKLLNNKSLGLNVDISRKNLQVSTLASGVDVGQVINVGPM